MNIPRVISAFKTGLTTVSATLTGFLNTLPWTIYRLVPTVRTDGQGGPLLSNNQSSLRTADDADDTASNAQRTERVDPEWTQNLAETLVDTTLVANDTYYPSTSGLSMDGYRNLSFVGLLTDDAGDTTTLTLEVSNFGGATAADWKQVYFYDAMNDAWVNSLAATATTTNFACCADNIGDFAFIRFRIQATDATGNAVEIHIKRVY